jgi:hypothetical protein
MEWGKPWKSSIRTAGFWAETWTHNLPNMKQECYQLGCDVRRLECAWSSTSWQQFKTMETSYTSHNTHLRNLTLGKREYICFHTNYD